MGSHPEDVRGTADRGLGRRSERERNVPAGNVVPLVPGRMYNVIGLDVGRADLSKRGVKEGLDPIVEALRSAPGPTTVVITGHASESTRPGKGAEYYEQQRAAKLRQYLESRGVRPESIVEHISGTPPPGSQKSAAAKAAARGATVEIVSSRAARGTDDRYGDPPTYFKGEPGWIPQLPPWRLPLWDPFLRDFRFPGRQSPPEQSDEPGQPGESWWRKRARDLLIGAAKRVALAGGLYFFLSEFIAEAMMEYGSEKVAKYVKERLVEELERRSDSGERFMRQMAAIISAKKRHPLAFLLDPKTKEWRMRRYGNQWRPGVQAGHTLSHSGGGFGFALEDAERNQPRRNSTIESKGGVMWSPAVRIAGVPVESGTALQWVTDGLLKPSALMGAPPTLVGWIDF